MNKKIKYRQYVFDGGKLIKVRYLEKLTGGAIKSKVAEVWETIPCYNVWCKICRIDSDIDFGTGIKEEYNAR